MNTDELKAINRSALIGELISKTIACGLLWAQPSASTYRTSTGDYDLYLVQTGSDAYTLDVLKDGLGYRSYNSAIQPDVKELFVAVSTLPGSGQQYDRVRDTVRSLSRSRVCWTPPIAPPVSGGIAAGGAAAVREIVVGPVVTLLPVSLEMEPPTENWLDGPLGNVTDGSDATYMRQTLNNTGVGGVGGFAAFRFDFAGAAGGLTLIATFTVRYRRADAAGIGLLVLLEGANADGDTEELWSYFDTPTDTAFGDAVSGAITLNPDAHAPGWLDTLVLRVGVFPALITPGGEGPLSTVHVSEISASVQTFTEV
jgi:hypothetical protein